MNEEEKLALLKKILLTDEREFAAGISSKIISLEETIQNREKLSKKINPIIKTELEQFTQEIPSSLGPIITETLKIEIQNSKDEVVEALYPILGKMIKKYISQEFKLLSEKINETARNTFSFASLKRKIKARATGNREEDMILNEIAQAQVEQVFVIEKFSGILLGSYQLKETVDQEMISGMLTAIKGFVEDAFGESGQNLQSIEYDLYEIHLQSFHKYYIATAVSGTFTDTHKDKLEDTNLNVSELINKKELLNNKSDLEDLLLRQYADLSFKAE